MRALVTGATGFIGTHLVAELRRRHCEVVCANHFPVRWDDPGITCVPAELTTPSSLAYSAAEVGRIDAVFHLGAVMSTVTPPVDAATYMMANFLATVHLLQTSQDLGAKSFVFASGTSVIGKPAQVPVTEDHLLRPQHAYALSKLCAEQHCDMIRRTENRCVAALRITSPYGPGMAEQTVLPRFVRAAMQSKDIQWFGTGRRTQNFVHVDDVVRALLLATENSRGGVYNVAGPASVSMETLARAIVRIVPGSHSRLSAAGRPDPQDDYRWEIDLTRARTLLGYDPQVCLEEGLARYAKWAAEGRHLEKWWSPA